MKKMYVLIGNYGSGKTELALRAIFKAIQDGKQAALLVPTTILAQQHYNTMCSRFADFPVKAACLSRFQTAKEREAVKEALEKVGTLTGRRFGDALFLTLAETTMEFAAREPARAEEFISLGFEAMWRALTREEK